MIKISNIVHNFNKNKVLINNQSDLIGLTIESNHTYSFMRGKVFKEVNIPVPVNNVKFIAHGQGNAPILSGAKDLTGSWTNVSGNLWKISATNVKWMFINGIEAELANMLSYVATLPTASSMTIEDSYPSDLVGAGITMRPDVWRWSINCTITDSSGGILTMAPNHIAEIGCLVMIYNHKNLLLKEKQWYFDSILNELWIYTIENPNDFYITYTQIDNCFEVNECENVLIEGLEIKNYYNAGVKANHVDNLQILNNTFRNIRYYGIYSTDASFYNKFNHNSFYNMSTGIVVTGLKISEIKYNYGRYFGFEKTKPIFKDYPEIRHQVGCFIDFNLDYSNYVFNPLNNRNVKVIGNDGRYCAYCAMRIEGDNHYIADNVVADFCTFFEDGGGIYTFGYYAVTPNGTCEKPIIRNNTIYVVNNSVWVFSIYTDLGTRNALVENNTIYKGSSKSTLYDHSGSTGEAANVYQNNSETII